MEPEPTGIAPAAGPAPRPSGRARRAASGAPRGIVAAAGFTVVSLLVAAVGPLPSHGAHVTPAPAAPAGVMDAPATRGCRPAPPPTPTPPPTPQPTPSPTPDPSASPSPSPTPSPPPTPKPTPTPYIPPGIDVSVWNGSLDYAPIAAKGMKFVIVKATQGTTLVDSRFAANIQRAREAGLLVGAYHFFDYTADGVAQADHFVDTAAAGGALSDAMPLAIDVECWSAFGWAVWAETVPRLRAMVDRVIERTGREPILYTSRHMWTQVVGGDRTFGDLPLWVACWRCGAPLLPAGWSRWRFWQIRPYTFKELGKSLDGNVFNGTDESLETWRGSSLLVNDGARMTAERLVTVDLSSFGGAHLRTADDGSDWSDWLPWAPTVQHWLSAGDGEREVRAQVRSEEGVEGPVLNDRILLDQTGPQLGPPVLTLIGGVIGRDGAIPVQVTWTAQDAIAGVASTTLVHDCGPGLGGEPLAAARTKAMTGARAIDRPTVRRRVAVAGDDAPIVTGTVPDGTCRLSVRGLDTLGNRTEATSPVVASTTITDQSELSLDPGSAWISRSQVASIGGSVLRTKTARATLRFGVQGDQVAIVATKGPMHGRMRVSLDGVTVADVDLYDAVKGPRSVVAVVPLPDDAPHRLRLTVLRTTNPFSNGRRVDLDAIIVAGETAPDPPPDPTPPAASDLPPAP